MGVACGCTNSDRWLLANMLPATVIEDSTQWNDRAAGNIAYVFDHLVIVDRGGMGRELADGRGSALGWR